jgi:CRISPR-associated protein Csd1
MFVQALAEYADNHLQRELEDVAFEERGVPYFLQIGEGGRFLGVTPRFDQIAAKSGKTGPKGKQRSQTHRVPRSPVNRNSGLHPLLGADDIKYVLGVGAWTSPEEVENHAERHLAFVTLISRVAEETKDEALKACSLFYARRAEVEKARGALASAVPGSNVALYALGDVVTEREAPQAWWRKAYAIAVSEASAEPAECLISGIVGPVAPTHPKIKHAAALGGRSEVSLMSFDKGAFRSYGWEQNANSPVCDNRAMAYVLALNDLLRPGGAHRQDFGDVAFLFWLRDESTENPAITAQQRPTPAKVAEVQQLLRLSRSASPDPDRFYMAAVSATGSRLILRSWVTELLPEALKNVLGWWEGLQMQPLAADEPLFTPHFWQLLHAIEREGKPTAGRVVTLLRRALQGSQCPLGYRFVADVLLRMRVDSNKRMDLPALGLLRLCLNDLHHSTGKGEPMSSSLDLKHPNTQPAYLCGRLLAIHDYLQWKTFDTAGETQPNATVADRYYTLFMNSPAVGMARVFDLGRKHLSKLRKLKTNNDAGANAAFGIEQQISEVERLLGGEPPKAFGMHDKARFALGFYHQKAYRPKKGVEDDSSSIEIDASLNISDYAPEKESEQ